MEKESTSIAPWLTVANSQKAASYYQEAFGAIETYRLETPDGGLVLKLSVGGAEFWVSGQSGDADFQDTQPENLGGDSIKMVLTVDNPDEVFFQALQAGGKEIFPVSEDYGWRLGRLEDPFGLHWEVGKPLKEI